MCIDFLLINVISFLLYKLFPLFDKINRILSSIKFLSCTRDFEENVKSNLEGILSYPNTLATSSYKSVSVSKSFLYDGIVHI